MRILICSNAYPPHFMGGAELMAHEQAKALARLGYEVRAFAGELIADRPRHARTDDSYEGVQVHRIATVAEDYSPEYLNFLHPAVDSHFQDILEEFRPDFVHFHNLMGLSVKLPVLARWHGARTVCTLHDFWGFCLRNTAVRADGHPCDDTTQCRSCLPRIHDGQGLHIPMRFRKDFLRLALDHVERFVAPSRFVADRYASAGFPADRLKIIPNGIDVARFRPAAAPAPLNCVRITYVGYLGAHKGVATLIEALALLNAPGTASSFLPVLQLVGEGPEEETCRTRAAALGLAGQVRFLGKVASEDMPGIYADSDIVVLASVWDENQPVCLMEAMAAGLPVVASRKGGIPELIEHGGNGFMFTAGDVHDLATQLHRLIVDSDLRHAMGCEGRQRVETLDHDHQAMRLSELYAQMAADTPALPVTPDIYAAIGTLRRRMDDEERLLADRRHPERYLMPRAWITGCVSGFRGIVLTGRWWSILRLLGISEVISLPRFRRKNGAARGKQVHERTK